MADRVVPNSLNYADIKPEAIESEIKLIKFTPTSTITGAKGGDVIKFLLTGNGFMDPYSTYFKFTVEVNDLAANEIRFLDRSAHSFFQRMVIRSQGVEIERIENYDVIAAMIHDVIYSPEQNALHHWEGFPNQQLQTPYSGGINASNGLNVPGVAFNSLALQGTVPSSQPRLLYSQLVNNGASSIVKSFVGEMCFHNLETIANEKYNSVGVNNYGTYSAGHAGQDVTTGGYALYYTKDAQQAPNGVASRNFPLDADVGVDFAMQKDARDLDAGTQWTGLSTDYGFSHPSVTPFDWGYHQDGQRMISSYPTALDSREVNIRGTTSMTFIVPIYSGLIGVLMPDKKLIPLNLLPLDIEITFNPHALYSSSSSANASRAYKISKFHMYSHMIFFEQEIHRSLEAAVAEHGIFLYCNSFHLAPTTLISGKVLPGFAYISMNLKSINSVHILFYYNNFETNVNARKLHFVSHNIEKMQLLNGTTLIPQEAIEGAAGTSKEYNHLPFILEMYKAWNKMHDPTTDGAIEAFNYCGDQYGKQFDPLPIDLTADNDSYISLMHLVNKQTNVGRCQYGISLEGEELGSDKTMVTGRKSQYPFLVYMSSNKGKLSARTSYMNTYLRADFIVYIRPDLQVVTLGK